MIPQEADQTHIEYGFPVVSRTKRSSDCAVGTLEFEFKEDSPNGRVSDWLRKICFRDGI